MSVPDNLRYTAQHEWLAIDGHIATVGITQYAADALGDVVYVELPAIGSHIRAGQACGEIESTKSVSDLYAPADGEVVSTNREVADNPGSVNTSPYDGGWLFQMRLSTSPDLMDASTYREHINDGA
jgi:glycine cleavage system H protein